MSKASNAIAIGSLSALSALVMAGCAIEEQETVTADCVDTSTRTNGGSYLPVDDRWCDGGSHGGYIYVYGGTYSGGYVRGGTTVRPGNVGISTRSGRVVVRGGFGGRGGGGGG